MLDPRGEIYTDDNIEARLTLRKFMDELRAGGIDTGGPRRSTTATVGHLPASWSACSRRLRPPNLLPNRPGERIICGTPSTKDKPLAKPNYQFEKRQKELAKKKKKEEKAPAQARRKPHRAAGESDAPAAQPPVEGENP